MSESMPLLRGKRILAVDDEKDVLDTIAEVLEDAEVDRALDFQTAVEKLETNGYDLAILDIMGVDGLTLLEKAVDRGIPSVMLTANALSAETLLASIRAGAVSYLPKEKLAELEELLEELLAAMGAGEPTWKKLFERLEGFFDRKFGPGWKDKDPEFWSEFSRTYHVSKDVQSRMIGREEGISKG